ncbi:sporulation membrane protein YtaF [Paenibacillus pinistramenti]|uniref:sporulation membrane protein YtaF n=1 Tax=Paenibacillus pinistramenti TaxID=1768003 RepID=UPI0011088E51|nr:sporulation membrane protein YtaF [Paenibacillus pinistramenti]
MSYHLLAILAIGLASNLDNAGVGIAYGVRKIRIPWYSNLAVALISFLGTLLSGMFGSLLSSWVHPWISKIAGSAVIILVGIWVLLQSSIEQKSKAPLPEGAGNFARLLRNPEEADKDLSNTISLSEATVLGIALAMNALAGGFNAGVTQLNIWLTSLSVGIFSYLLFALSFWFGKKYAAEKLGSRATVISGILLILIGLAQVW